jgi:uncharacterized membrane protein YbhN (UPF0104 family)
MAPPASPLAAEPPPAEPPRSASASAFDAPSKAPPSRRRLWWIRARRLLVIGFAVVVGWLLISHARSIEWSAVGTALRQLSPQTLAMGAGMALLSFLFYSSFDLLGRRYIGHRLPPLRTMVITVVCYVFNLNLGAIVGGVAFRYRLYSRLGLSTGEITQIMGLSMLTNWLGYMLLAGLVFATGTVGLPPDWLDDSATAAWIGSALSGVGIGMMAVPMLYLAACAWSPRRSVTVRGQTLKLPSIRLGLTQIILSVLHWLATAGILYMLLQERIEYPVVLGVLMVSAIAGVITHIPAGLGVVEAVFIALLGHRVPHTELLAALLAYRAVFYIIPLMIAFAAYLQLEATARAAKARLEARPLRH